MKQGKLLTYFDLTYESYINGNRSDHRERFFKMNQERKLAYLLYLYSVAGKSYPDILVSLNA